MSGWRIEACDPADPAAVAAVAAYSAELDALLGTGGNGIVETHALDVAAITGAAAVSDDDVVEGTLLGAATS